MNPGSVIWDPNPYEDPDPSEDPDFCRIRIYDKKDPDHPSGSQNGKNIWIPDFGSRSRSSTMPDANDDDGGGDGDGGS